MADPLTYDEVIEIRELKNEDGLTYDEIEDQTGRSSTTISRALKMSDEKLESLREAPTPGEIDKAGRGQSLKASTKVRRFTEDQVAARATRDLSEVMRIGNYGQSKWKKIAEDEGYDDIVDYINHCIKFQRYNEGRVKKLKNLVKFQRMVMAKMIIEYRKMTSPENRKREMRNLILSSHITGNKLPNEVYQSYLKMLGGENNA